MLKENIYDEPPPGCVEKEIFNIRFSGIIIYILLI